ncbi:basic salivary proline-rich protein 2-like [Alosa alosa]|uniref:basic salivary proline-rich protein 2-like n=1 Tax=Alosa alosa TaxID=278164 RepID=UPI0020153EAC|nr:basic salivary proline-rich protein 2-like [Alosa alosa]
MAVSPSRPWAPVTAPSQAGRPPPISIAAPSSAGQPLGSPSSSAARQPHTLQNEAITVLGGLPPPPPTPIQGHAPPAPAKGRRAACAPSSKESGVHPATFPDAAPSPHLHPNPNQKVGPVQETLKSPTTTTRLVIQGGARSWKNPRPLRRHAGGVGLLPTAPRAPARTHQARSPRGGPARRVPHPIRPISQGLIAPSPVPHLVRRNVVLNRDRGGGPALNRGSPAMAPPPHPKIGPDCHSATKRGTSAAPGSPSPPPYPDSPEPPGRPLSEPREEERAQEDPELRAFSFTLQTARPAGCPRPPLQAASLAGARHQGQPETTAASSEQEMLRIPATPPERDASASLGLFHDLLTPPPFKNKEQRPHRGYCHRTRRWHPKRPPRPQFHSRPAGTPQQRKLSQALHHLPLGADEPSDHAGKTHAILAAIRELYQLLLAACRPSLQPTTSSCSSRTRPQSQPQHIST